MCQDDQNPTQFLVCMTGRLLTRLDRLNEENDLGRMKFIKYHVQLDGLGGVHGLKKRKSTAQGVVWFINHMSGLRVSNQEMFQKFAQLRHWRSCQAEEPFVTAWQHQ